MNDDGEITLVSTAVSRLVTFLQDGMDVAGVEPNEQRNMVRVNLNAARDDFILIMPEELNEYHIVGDHGLSIVARGVYSLGTVLAGIGVRGRDDSFKPVNGWLFQKRMEKAMRLINAASLLEGHPVVDWAEVARLSREMKPSSQTLACIAALLEEQ